MAAINVVSSVLPECIHMLVYIIPRVTKIFTLSPHIKQQRNMLYHDFTPNVIIYFSNRARADLLFRDYFLSQTLAPLLEPFKGDSQKFSPWHTLTLLEFEHWWVLLLPRKCR